MNIDIVAVLGASVAQFVVGAIWYMPLFGSLWGRMHGFDEKSPEVQAEMQKVMMPLMLLQFAMTVVMAGVLSMMLGAVPSYWNPYGLAGFLWLGFIVPTQIGAVVFGGTEPKWVVKKILVMAGGALATMMAGTFVLTQLM